jgi:cytochrome P450 family 110
MALATSIPQKVSKLHLNPFQQWQFFSQPRVMHDWLREHYGDLAQLHFQGRDYAAILTPQAVRAVFSADPYGYDAFWKESFTNLIGRDNVWVLIGERHRRERQLFAPAVHANHFRAYGQTIQEIARENLAKWQPGQTVKALDTTLAISLDIIMRLVFGVEEAKYMEEGRQVFEVLRQTAYPLVVFFPALQKPWFPLWRRYLKSREDVLGWMDRFLAARRARSADDTDVLGVLMNARDEAGNPVSDEHIRNELNAILTAGHETTGVALAWALYELGRHPEILAKLCAELGAAGPALDPARALTLPYLDAVCKETVRLHPILSECARVPMQSIQILGRDIAPGQAMVISIVGIHHDPGTYPEPDRFRPERFIERNYDIFEFLPFGGGHRRCMGAGLAEYSMRISLAEIVTRWDFEPTEPDTDIRLNVAMGPRKGIPLRIKARKN